MLQQNPDRHKLLGFECHCSFFPLQRSHSKCFLPKVKTKDSALTIVNFSIGVVANFHLSQTAMTQMLTCNCSFFLDLVFHLRSVRVQFDMIGVDLQTVSEMLFNCNRVTLLFCNSIGPVCSPDTSPSFGENCSCVRVDSFPLIAASDALFCAKKEIEQWDGVIME